MEEELVTLMLGQREVRFSYFPFSEEEEGGRPSSPKIAFVSLHSNEISSRNATRLLLEEVGGFSYSEIHAGGDRRLHLRPKVDGVSIDPNRMFSAVGIERDLRRGGIARAGDLESIERFAESYVERFLEGVSVIVAVHNNARGGYSVRSYLEGGAEAASASKVSVVEGQKEDNFFLVTTKDLFTAIQRLGYNVVLQAQAPPDDGSLSVYCGARGIPYVNVEAEHGDEAFQVKMIGDLLRLLRGNE